MTTLTDAERVDIRRQCGYPAYGAAPSGMQSWRFYQAYGALEFRITNLSDAEIAVARSYITALSALELAVTAAADNLDTDEAAVWVRNKTEIVDRITVFDEWRRRLCGFLGVPPGPALHGRDAALVV